MGIPGDAAIVEIAGSSEEDNEQGAGNKMKYVWLVVAGMLGLFIGVCAFIKSTEKIEKVKIVGNYKYDDEYIGV